VLVKNGKVVGRGYHHRAGEPHAEVNAVLDAGRAARGATLYVTLEPCCTHGRTPPCTGLIVETGIGEVVIGCLDPNPEHSGRGVKILRKAGVEVRIGVLEKECLRLNEAFFKWIAAGIPFVTLKLAMTLDGKIATATGESKWISGPQARQRVQRLRMAADAVMVGAGTARADRPSLLVRTKGWWRQPRRLVATKSMDAAKLKSLMPSGGPDPEPVRASGRSQWTKILRRLGNENVVSVLVEGGGELAADLLRSGVVDKLELHVAPKILGGRNSRSAVAGPDSKSLDKALQVKEMECGRLGTDLIITGYL